MRSDKTTKTRSTQRIYKWNWPKNGRQHSEMKWVFITKWLIKEEEVGVDEEVGHNRKWKETTSKKTTSIENHMRSNFSVCCRWTARAVRPKIAHKTQITSAYECVPVHQIGYFVQPLVHWLATLSGREKLYGNAVQRDVVDVFWSIFLVICLIGKRCVKYVSSKCITQIKSLSPVYRLFLLLLSQKLCQWICLAVFISSFHWSQAICAQLW